MRVTLAIALGGAIGAVGRYWFTIGAKSVLGVSFPYGTLGVNVIGSFFMGLLLNLLVQRLHASPALEAAALVGLLGAFTTFSTFSMDTLQLFKEAGSSLAATYVVANVVLSIMGCALGFWLSEQL